MFRRFVAMLAIAMVVAIAGAASIGGVAAADEPDYTDLDVIVELLNTLNASDDPDAAFLSLPQEAQNAIINAFQTQTTLEVEETVASSKGQGRISLSSDDPNDPETERCDTHTISVTKRLAGVKIYTYKTKTRWCFNGRIITQTPSFNVSARLHWKLWWEFVKHVRESESGGKGERTHTDFAQGHFKNCPPGFGCVHYYPSIEKTQTAKGKKSSVSHEE